MKKISFLFILCMMIPVLSKSQSALDVYRVSQSQVFGTARAMGMGGAFGALGGDITGVRINPAGIGVYRGSEVVGTLSITNDRHNAIGKSMSKSYPLLDNLGIITSIPTFSPIAPFFNMGISYNSESYSIRDLSLKRIGTGASISRLMADYANATKGNLSVDQETSPFETQPWLAVFGYNGYLINENNGKYSSVLAAGNKVNQAIRMDDRLNINNINFTMGTRINGVLSLGLGMNVKSYIYTINSAYKETLPSKNTDSEGNSFTLKNSLTTHAEGLNLSVGLLYNPVEELRLGISYESPTWMVANDMYNASMKENMTGYVNSKDYKPGETVANGEGDFVAEYKVTTPSKLTLSAATILMKRLALSADYELTNYGSMHSLTINSDSYSVDDTSASLKTMFKTSSAFRLGAELRITPLLYGRLGYSWIESPYSTNFKKGNESVETAGSITTYTIFGDKNTYSFGLGYRFSPRMYGDFAMMFSKQNNKFYSFPSSKSNINEPFKINDTQTKMLFTIGYRF